MSEEIRINTHVEREILKEILNKKTLVINVNDIENNYSIPSNYFITENLISLYDVKKLLDSSEIDFID
ncbi:MAG: hypothetical protein OWS74_03090, partial [Firmicutes bacterium]|nr:hypothetical protein [Bacillota bacterium]